MFDLFGDDPGAAGIISEAERILGRDPLTLEGPSLFEPVASQILTVAAALALHARLADHLPDRLILAGYSVGEMAAWSVAGAWPAVETLRLVETRARTMSAAGGGDGGLCHVRGLDRRRVDALAATHRCEIAIVNPDRLFILGGADRDLDALCAAASAAGASRAGRLKVPVAAHTSMLAAAVAPFLDALERSAPSSIPAARVLLSGATGARIFEPRRELTALARSVATRLDWAECLDAAIEAGADRFLELGPGQALTNMVSGHAPGARARAAGEFQTLDGLIAWIGCA